MKLISTAQFEKQFNKVPKKTADNIYRKLIDFKNDAANVDIKKLKARKEYRIRIGDYRVFFEYLPYENEISILLKEVEHRKDVYKIRG